MKKEWIKRGVSVAALGLALYFITASATNNAFASLNPLPTGGREQQGEEGNKPVEQAFKNIQTLKGMPQSQLLAVMHFMRTSLGVRCDYCHIAENGKYWMDDKPAKQSARRMIQLVFDINKASFGGKPVITCNTCHQGRAKPISVPAIGQGAFENTTREDPPAKPADPWPTVDQVLDSYVQALGGRAAIEKIQTRVTKITLLRPLLVDSGTPKARMVARGDSLPIEVYQKAPDKYLAVITTPDGIVYQGFNGTTGWVKSASGTHAMNAAEVVRIKRQADFYSDLKLKEKYSTMTVVGKERIGDQETYVIEAINRDNKTEKLFFSVQTGLLLRRTVFTETVLGLDPEQTDYEDYREVGGVRQPYTVRVSYLDDSHYGLTRKLSEINFNVSLDDEKFEMPATKQ